MNLWLGDLHLRQVCWIYVSVSLRRDEFLALAMSDVMFRPYNSEKEHQNETDGEDKEIEEGFMHRDPSPADMALLSDLEREIDRLERERRRAAIRSDRLLAHVNLDETGFTFHRALRTVSGLDERLSQLRSLVEKVHRRVE